MRSALNNVPASLRGSRLRRLAPLGRKERTGRAAHVEGWVRGRGDAVYVLVNVALGAEPIVPVRPSAYVEVERWEERAA